MSHCRSNPVRSLLDEILATNLDVQTLLKAEVDAIVDQLLKGNPFGEASRELRERLRLANERLEEARHARLEGMRESLDILFTLKIQNAVRHLRWAQLHYEEAVRILEYAEKNGIDTATRRVLYRPTAPGCKALEKYYRKVKQLGYEVPDSLDP